MKREEVLYEGKRYRIHNNYLTLGGGYMLSSIRSGGQKWVGGDFQFHVRQHHFQFGAFMSGDDFFANTNTQVHAGYGLRRERNTTNFAAYIGPSYFTGVTGTPGISGPFFYDGFGAYMSLQAISKIVSYDIGIGAELFGEISSKQAELGIKLIVFFSGAYRGIKRNYNPNVRAENPNLK